MPYAFEQADSFLKKHEDTRQRFDRVANLIKGFETTFGMELLSTVHWVATREQAKTPEEAVIKIYDWNTRKRMFESRHIHLAWKRLHETFWLT